jgi:hypothetical protein
MLRGARNHGASFAFHHGYQQFERPLLRILEPELNLLLFNSSTLQIQLPTSLSPGYYFIDHPLHTHRWPLKVQ